MGWNSVAVLYNDHFGEIESAGPLGQRIADAMRDYHDSDRTCRNFGAGVVISQDHADGEQVVIVHANYGYRADEAEGLGWMALDQMQRCLERHGYKVARPKRVKPPAALPPSEDPTHG